MLLLGQAEGVKMKAQRKRANLRDVAAAAQVSVATVSRVMNAPETVAEKTRARVEQAMQELRWLPSAAARAINSGRTRFVGALVPTLEHDIFARVLAGLERQLASHRLSLVVATTDDDPRIEAEKAQGLIDIGAEGLMVSGMTHTPEFFGLIEREGIDCEARRAGTLHCAHAPAGMDDLRERLRQGLAAGAPLELPDNVRAYLISSTPHSNSFGVHPGPVAHCQLPSNPLHRGGPARALLVALDRSKSAQFRTLWRTAFAAIALP